MQRCVIPVWLKRLHLLEHARRNEVLGYGLAPFLARGLGHAPALEGYDADAMRF